ncbi:MAG: TSUP family transporter [Marinilabiliales bacterium]|nr:TSUP family transporter [Marinilabiliales bacterium]
MDMTLMQPDLSLLTWISLGCFAFLAGFVDAGAGGGGLIQLPALLIQFPSLPIATLFGTNKIAALSGTTVAAYQYSKRIRYNYLLLAIISFAAFGASYCGAKVVSLLNANALKPIVLIILILIAIYTYLKKDLGSVRTKQLPSTTQGIYGALIGAVVGFYDGFFGPGTGSFLVLGFVVILGFEFVTASAYAKVVNCMTNLSALFVFVRQGNYLLPVALLMAVSNVAGNITGSRLALSKGNRYVRIMFLLIILLMIARYGYDIFRQYAG